ncbi:hypothetical protein SAMN06297387_1521 [Streptomyces zhaozhouensis]|uniref:Uncharacterized protein n=1 Tax=Streptomyces zhaozhouensis TaxID=1300267 RepID=A0A286EAU5_9ACTN|nr:hypothetical protein [Streptomyces zhaozhouensis]SOD68032.1 hypothetical protein SAMN06297387_1521 [Streptomyces zhaozhouensis]
MPTMPPLPDPDHGRQLSLEDIPAPYAPRGEGVLDARERADLAVCEEAIGATHRSLLVAGRALATINRGRLYRESHPTFEAYVEDRWSLSRSYVYRMIRALPVAEAVWTIGHTELTEGQARELLPVIRRWGPEGVRIVYEAVAAMPGRPTAARLQAVVALIEEHHLARPEQTQDLVQVATATGRLQTTPPVPGPQPVVEAPADTEGGEEQAAYDVQAAAEYAAAEDLQRALRTAADDAEQLQRRLQRLADQAQHTPPLDQGAALETLQRIRRAGRQIATIRLDLEGR